MNREQAIKKLGISLSTFKRWCKALDIEINKSDYTDDIKSLEQAKEKIKTLGWNGFLESLGKPQQQPTNFSSGLVARYSPDIEKTADSISDGLLEALDVAVAKSFAKKLGNKPSPIFSQLLGSFSGALSSVSSLGDSDALYFLEGEIVDE